MKNSLSQWGLAMLGWQASVHPDRLLVSRPCIALDHAEAVVVLRAID